MEKGKWIYSAEVEFNDGDRFTIEEDSPIYYKIEGEFIIFQNDVDSKDIISAHAIKKIEFDFKLNTVNN